MVADRRRTAALLRVAVTRTLNATGLHLRGTAMSCEAETAQVLRQMGHKLTPQRLMVASVVRHHGGHLNAAEIYEQVKRTYPFVNISTVYRTLTLLRELRLVNET